MATNVPKITFYSAGVSLPSESDILSGALSDIDDAFGGGVNKALTTPQGQLATSLSAIIADKNEQIAMISNQVNPDYAEGIFQDAIGRIYFLDRKPALSTTVTCQCIGVAGTVIPAGARAQDIGGNIYLCTSGGTIPALGSVDLQFHAQETGPIPCPSGNVTTIYQTIPGWDSITNAAAGVPGTDVESRADFETRRRNSVALNAHGSASSIYANVFNVYGVTDCYVTENSTGTEVNYGATEYSLASHSVYVSVVGGDDEDVAKAIWDKKDMGCNMNGNTTVTVFDKSYTAPYPEYEITFERPSALPILFAVSIADRGNLPSDIVDQVRAAIVSAFSGGDGGERARIGGTIYASRFYAPVASISPQLVAIISILIGTSTATETYVEAGIDEVPTVQESDISVVLV